MDCLTDNGLENAYKENLQRYTLVVGIKDNYQQAESIFEPTDLSIVYDKVDKKYILEIEGMLYFTKIDDAEKFYRQLRYLLLFYLREKGYSTDIYMNTNSNKVFKTIQDYMDFITEKIEDTDLNTLLTKFFNRF